MIGHFGHKGFYLICGDDCARGVVGVADKNKAGSVTDRPRHSLQVQTVVPQRRLDQPRSHHVGVNVVYGERGATDDDLALLIQVCQADLHDDAVRSVAHGDLLRPDPQVFRQRVAQVITLPVRVKVQARERPLYSRQRLGRRA